VIPLARASARFQPIWVEDVGRCFTGALGNMRTYNQTYELCGPRVYTLGDLVRYVGEILGRHPRIVALPDAAASLQAFVFEHLPGKILTRDNLRSMSVDNVGSAPFPEVFGFQPSALEAIVPEYLLGMGGRARYASYRGHAGR
jgi:uncharacterized protein YbjT (DUF2867 family)